MVKSIAIVLGSYILSVALVIGSDPLLSRLFPGDFVSGHIPSSNALLASTGFFILISLLCAWICARFAPNPAGRHVLWFFILGEVMGIVSIIPNWGKGWPHWYFLSWLVAWPICCWLALQVSGRRTTPAAQLA